MPGEYTLHPTSASSAQVPDISLSDPERADTALTRRVLRSLLVDNVHDRASSVNVTIVHQRRATRNGPWQDSPPFKLPTLKAGEEVRLHLEALETKALFEALRDLYTLGEQRIPPGPRRLQVVDADDTQVIAGHEREVLARVLASEGGRLWELLEQVDPGFVHRMALAELYESRRQVVREFEEHLAADDWSEGEWEGFFRANKWIFGHNLAYQFLSEVQGQPHFGGTTLAGSGGQRGDFLLATDADVRFTVLVEIKKPGSALLGREYRNKVYESGGDLAGGIAQLQSNCRTWAIEGSRQDENAEELREQHVFTYEPKGVLVIGHTAQLDTFNKRSSFELLRRNLHNPEIVTYDELLARARHGVSFDAT